MLDKKICSEYNSPEKHHIFPKAVLHDLRIKHRHLLANFAFIPGELNREIGAARPSEYFAKFKRENPHFDNVLATHLIPSAADSPIWKDDYEAFTKARVDLIFHEIEKLVGKIGPIEVELERNPGAVVDRLEAETRAFIDGTLTERVGEYWERAVPEGTRELVKKRMAERMRRHPYEQHDEDTNYQRLSYCDMDYAQIILKNWEAFEGVLGSRGEVERRFLNIKEYRNSLKHAREMNTVEKKQGEASVEWLFRILERAKAEQRAEGGAPPAEQEDGENGGATEKKDAATLESLLAKPKERQTLERIRDLMAFCEAFPDVQRYTTRTHIVYKTTRAFAFIYPQRHQFWVDVLRRGVSDPHQLLKHNHPVFGHIQVPNDLDLEHIKDLIGQSYNSTMAKLALGAN